MWIYIKLVNFLQDRKGDEMAQKAAITIVMVIAILGALGALGLKISGLLNDAAAGL
jgi:hypothetical protein